jgi:hypothetical protein
MLVGASFTSFRGGKGWVDGEGILFVSELTCGCCLPFFLGGSSLKRRFGLGMMIELV